MSRQSIWIKLAIDQLKEINLKRQSLENVQERIINLKPELSSVRATAVSLAPAVGGELNKQESWLVDCMALQRELEVSERQLKFEIESFDKAWGNLSDEEKTVLEQFYIDRPRDYIDKLCNELSCEKSKVYQLKDEAIYKFTMQLYGRY